MRGGPSQDPDIALQQAVIQHINTGNALMRQGQHAAAAAAYSSALAIKGDSPELLNNLGTALMYQDRLDEAATVYARALALKPDYVGALYNLGNIFLRQNRLVDAAASYRRALAAAPDYAAAHNNLGNALERQGQVTEAEACYRRAVAIDAKFAQAQLNLGNVLLRQDRLGEAQAVYRILLVLAPDFPAAHYNLGSALCESNRNAEGFAEFTRAAELVYQKSSPPSQTPELPHKLRHDREQQDYLGKTGALPFHLADGGRLATPAVNPANAAETAAPWKTARPQIAVIDNLLTPLALEKLRRFCWDSTIWKKPYDGGYIGAMPEHGVACPLLAQIADELRDTFPDIFQDHPLHYLWAYKYDSRLPGIKIHADQAAVNVNFWITPDEANLDPQSGGLVVWDATAPADWELTKYNGDEAACRAFLQRAGAKPVTIPYRANRAVIFDSDLFHETDKIDFKDGYLNRRINVTLLFGRRAAQARSAGPDAEALVSAGNDFMQQGKFEEAVTAYGKALAQKPGSVEARNNLGNAQERLGRLEDAAESYRRALAITPDDAEVHYNLGNVFAQQSQWDDAAIAYRGALAAKPDFTNAQFNLGNVLMRQRKPEDAAAAYQSVLAALPDFSKAHFNLGEALCQIGQIETGFAAFTRAAELTPETPETCPTPSFKLRHDLEQRDYLAAAAIGSAFHLADGSRLATPAVNPDNGGGDIAARWQASQPQMVVVDNFLTPKALEKLRRFCWGSTIWRRIYEGGYLSATPEHGLACPLLAQVAEELRATFPAIIGAHPFRYLWAVKYDSRHAGTKIHADQAAINVNFWITPDEANRDPETGGMVIWDVAAPLDWQSAQFNGDVTACRDFLARSGAQPVRVPYRSNRAVIFDSDLFHETDKIDFKDGYLDRRINITLIYGRRTSEK